MNIPRPWTPRGVLCHPQGVAHAGQLRDVELLWLFSVFVEGVIFEAPDVEELVAEACA